MKLMNYIKSNTIFIILAFITILSLFYVFYCTTECYCTIIKNVSYSIIAAAIFYVIIDYIPLVRKKKIMRTFIDMQFSKLYGHINQCVNGIISPFSFNPKTYKDKEDFADDFYSVDLEEKIEKFISNTRKSYLESYRDQINNIVERLLDLHSYLSYKELENLTFIVKSEFLTQSINPHIKGLPPEIIDTYPNNQREIGESIFEIYELIKDIKQ